MLESDPENMSVEPELVVVTWTDSATEMSSPSLPHPLTPSLPPSFWEIQVLVSGSVLPASCVALDWPPEPLFPYRIVGTIHLASTLYCGWEFTEEQTG